MKKNVLLLAFAALMFSAVAQEVEEETSGRKGKFFLIPELWLSFGNSTYIDIAPMVGYHVLDRLSLGLGPHYIYESVKSTPYYPAYQSHTYGIKSFTRFALITNAEEWLPIKLFSELYFHMEYEWLSLEEESYVPPYTGEGRYDYHGILVGGGLAQRIGFHNSVSFTVLWDINNTGISPYSNPVFRVGFNTYL